MPRLQTWGDLLWAAGVLAGIVAFAFLTSRLVLATFRSLTRNKRSGLEGLLARGLEQPVSWLVPLVLLSMLMLPMLPMLPEEALVLRHAILLAIIGCFTWIALELMKVAEEWLAERYQLQTDENLASRKIRTQIVVLRRIAIMIILVLSVAAMLMTFPGIWHIGMGLFASAGLAGLLAGAAARPALSNLLAGVQIAFSDLIHVDDMVVVDGQWGRIEEIGTTNVFVRLGDLRRLIVPLSYFMEHPFQDWSRVASDLVGTVFFYVDFSAPVDELRSELQNILHGSPLWNGRLGVLQVTNITERTMELRALVSATDAERCWDLSCYVREELVQFLNRRHPDCLPRVRAEFPVAV